MRRSLPKLLTAFGSISSLSLACSGQTPTGNQYGLTPAPPGSGGSGSAQAGSSAAGSAGTEVTGVGGAGAIQPPSMIPTNQAGNAGSGGVDGMNCGAENHQAMVSPLAIYLLVDWSASMTERTDLWTPVKTALNAFVSDPASAGIEVGLGYFPITSTDLTMKCDPAQYVTPSVGVGLLPDTTLPITSSLDEKMFTLGEIPDDRLSTPTAPALTGSLQYFSEWLTQHPDHIGVLVLATDGEPAGCDPQSLEAGAPVVRGTPAELEQSVAAIAAAAGGATPIKTYVIGIGDLRQALDQLAAAGDTGQEAFIVDATGTNTQEEFLAAMKAIRGESLPCEFEVPLPTTGDRDFEKVNVDFTADASSGMTAPFYRVDGAEACGTSPNAWYYDDPLNPTAVVLCEEACKVVVSSETAKVGISLGCTTRVR